MQRVTEAPTASAIITFSSLGQSSTSTACTLTVKHACAVKRSVKL